jgi:hypothetical protein
MGYLWQGQIRCAQDLADQMKAMRAAEKRWETQVSLVLRYTLYGFCILLCLCPVGHGFSILGL